MISGLELKQSLIAHRERKIPKKPQAVSLEDIAMLDPEFIDSAVRGSMEEIPHNPVAYDRYTRMIGAILYTPDAVADPNLLEWVVLNSLNLARCDPGFRQLCSERIGGVVQRLGQSTSMAQLQRASNAATLRGTQADEIFIGTDELPGSVGRPFRNIGLKQALESIRMTTDFLRKRVEMPDVAGIAAQYLDTKHQKEADMFGIITSVPSDPRRFMDTSDAFGMIPAAITMYGQQTYNPTQVGDFYYNCYLDGPFGLIVTAKKDDNRIHPIGIVGMELLWDARQGSYSTLLLPQLQFKNPKVLEDNEFKPVRSREASMLCYPKQFLLECACQFGKLNGFDEIGIQSGQDNIWMKVIDNEGNVHLPPEQAVVYDRLAEKAGYTEDRHIPDGRIFHFRP